MAKETKGAKQPRTGEERFAAYLDAIAAVVGHSRRAAAARAYCTGLLLPGERKSIEPMAARLAPERVQAAHQSLHHVVAQAEWDDAALLRAVGKQDNCQVAVSLSVASDRASVPIAWRLYLPETWMEDPPWCMDRPTGCLG